MSSYKFSKVVDLSNTLYREMPSWPTLPSLKYEYIAWAARDFYTMTLITQMTTHTGTHVDAPAHFIPDGKTVDQIPIEGYVGEGVVLDLSYKKAGEEIVPEDLKQYDSEIKEGEVVMLHTNWDKKRGLNKEYLFMWPHLGVEAAKYLVSKKIKAVGINGLSIGGWADEVPTQGPIAKSSPTEVHQILLKAGIRSLKERKPLELSLFLLR